MNSRVEKWIGNAWHTTLLHTYVRVVGLPFEDNQVAPLMKRPHLNMATNSYHCLLVLSLFVLCITKCSLNRVTDTMDSIHDSSIEQGQAGQSTSSQCFNSCLIENFFNNYTHTLCLKCLSDLELNKLGCVEIPGSKASTAMNISIINYLSKQKFLTTCNVIIYILTSMHACRVSGTGLAPVSCQTNSFCLVLILVQPIILKYEIPAMAISMCFENTVAHPLAQTVTKQWHNSASRTHLQLQKCLFGCANNCLDDV